MKHEKPFSTTHLHLPQKNAELERALGSDQESPSSLGLHRWTNLEVAKVPRLAALRRVCGSVLHARPDNLAERTGQGKAADTDSI